ncbi:hypothetical protein PVAP13_2KG289534, partial [Panicum virgatum]
PTADVASQLTGGVMLHHRGKAYWQGWLTGEGGATLRQCSSRMGTARLTAKACDAAAASYPILSPVAFKWLVLLSIGDAHHVLDDLLMRCGLVPCHGATQFV